MAKDLDMKMKTSRNTTILATALFGRQAQSTLRPLSKHRFHPLPAIAVNRPDAASAKRGENNPMHSSRGQGRADADFTKLCLTRRANQVYIVIIARCGTNRCVRPCTPSKSLWRLVESPASSVRLSRGRGQAAMPRPLILISSRSSLMTNVVSG